MTGRDLTYRALLWLVGCMVFAAGCEGGCSSRTLAELKQADGEVTRDHAKTVGDWQKAAVGSRFGFGDAVRTSAKATARVLFDDGAGIQLKEKTTIRFLNVPPDSGEHGLSVEAGNVTLEVGKAAMRLRTDVGLARIEAGTVINIGKGERGTRFFVEVGAARIETKGKEESLRAGQGLEVSVGQAVIERFGASDSDAEASAEKAPEPKQEESDDSFEKAIKLSVSKAGASSMPPGAKVFSPLRVGESVIEPGTKLKLNHGNSAEVARGKHQASLSGPGEFLVTGDAESFVTPLRGSTILTADGSDVALDIEGGQVIARGSKERSVGEVSFERKLVTIHAHKGTITVAVGAKREELKAGERARVEKGGKIAVSGRGIGFADYTLAAGGSLALHDPEPPTAIGFTFQGKCEGRGVIELLGGKAAGTSASGNGSANLRVPNGSYRYRLRCLSESGLAAKAAADGTITIMHDSGTRPLAAGAPTSFVDTDGRSYTVMYQNRLPKVLVRWPHPPSAGGYVLHHSGPGGPSTVNTARPAHTFDSGVLREGTHRLSFSADGKRSKTTTLSIRFDNAAPKANIKAPANGAFSGGETVNVAGIALPGWKVSAAGKQLNTDAQHRFNGSVSSGPRGFVIQFEHPARGSHLYLRRASGVPR